MPGKLREVNRKVELRYFEPELGQVYLLPARTDYHMLHRYILHNYDSLQALFKKHGLRFVYPPKEILDSFTTQHITELAQYYFPWAQADSIPAIINASMLSCTWLIKDTAPEKPYVSDYCGRRFLIHPTPVSSYQEQFEQIAQAYSTPTGTYSNHPKKKENPELKKIDFRVSYTPEGLSLAARKKYPYPELDTTRQSQASVNEPDELDTMFLQLRRDMPEWAIRELLSKALRSNEILSRLVITEQLRLILPDYNNKEIIMTPKAKALYLLFLRHPEGLYLKNLPDYKDQLRRIYGRLARRDDKQAIDQAIDTLILSISGDADTQRSRIKMAVNTAFADQICCDYGKWYIINGSRGGIMKIDLPQDKIIWEADI